MDKEQALGLLETEPGASQEEVKKAFRSLAMKYHPDKGGDARLFIAAKQAYDYLVKYGTEVPVKQGPLFDLWGRVPEVAQQQSTQEHNQTQQAHANQSQQPFGPSAVSLSELLGVRQAFPSRMSSVFGGLF